MPRNYLSAENWQLPISNALTPFDYRKHTQQDVGLGGPSTEYLITEEAPDGGFWNIPSIWWDKDGNPVMLTPSLAQMIARNYEQSTGQRFPRYENPGAGAFGAMNRSAMGGANNGLLVDWGD